MTLKATIWAVMVVPMSAPRITPMAWDRDMSPAVTKPTSMTVVTDEDWMMAVTKAPVIRPMMRLLVSRARICFMLSPATFFRASAICSMPYRNTARPPSRVMPIIHQSIACPPSVVAAARTGMAIRPAATPRINVKTAFVSAVECYEIKILVHFQSPMSAKRQCVELNSALLRGFLSRDTVLSLRSAPFQQTA